MCFSAQAEPGPDCAAELRSHAGRVDAYLQRRDHAVKDLAAMRQVQSPAQISARQRAFAARIRGARPDARTGAVLGASEGCIAQIVRDDWRRRAAQDRKALLVEMPSVPAPAVNADYPKDVPRATIPPALLERLPPLPAQLEYALLGRHLVLRDTEADLIVDVLPDVLGPGGPP